MERLSVGTLPFTGADAPYGIRAGECATRPYLIRYAFFLTALLWTVFSRWTVRPEIRGNMRAG